MLSKLDKSLEVCYSNLLQENMQSLKDEVLTINTVVPVGAVLIQMVEVQRVQVLGDAHVLISGVVTSGSA